MGMKSTLMTKIYVAILLLLFNTKVAIQNEIQSKLHCVKCIICTYLYYYIQLHRHLKCMSLDTNNRNRCPFQIIVHSFKGNKHILFYKTIFLHIFLEITFLDVKKCRVMAILNSEHLSNIFIYLQWISPRCNHTLSQCFNNSTLSMTKSGFSSMLEQDFSQWIKQQSYITLTQTEPKTRQQT